MFNFIKRKIKPRKKINKNKAIVLFNKEFAENKLKKNNRNTKGKLYGHKTYYSETRGIVLIDETRIKKLLEKRYKKVFV